MGALIPLFWISGGFQSHNWQPCLHLVEAYVLYRVEYSFTFGELFLPSAMKLQRLCFYRCLSVHSGGLPQCMLGYTPPRPPPSRHTPPKEQTLPQSRHPLESRHPPEADTPLEQTTPPVKRPLLRTVRILLECILVYQNVYLLSSSLLQIGYFRKISAFFKNVRT